MLRTKERHSPRPLKMLMGLPNLWSPSCHRPNQGGVPWQRHCCWRGWPHQKWVLGRSSWSWPMTRGIHRRPPQRKGRRWHSPWSRTPCRWSFPPTNRIRGPSRFPTRCRTQGLRRWFESHRPPHSCRNRKNRRRLLLLGCSCMLRFGHIHPPQIRRIRRRCPHLKDNCPGNPQQILPKCKTHRLGKKMGRSCKRRCSCSPDKSQNHMSRR